MGDCAMIAWLYARAAAAMLRYRPASAVPSSRRSPCPVSPHFRNTSLSIFGSLLPSMISGRVVDARTVSTVFPSVGISEKSRCLGAGQAESDKICAISCFRHFCPRAGIVDDIPAELVNNRRPVTGSHRRSQRQSEGRGEVVSFSMNGRVVPPPIRYVP